MRYLFCGFVFVQSISVNESNTQSEHFFILIQKLSTFEWEIQPDEFNLFNLHVLLRLWASGQTLPERKKKNFTQYNFMSCCYTSANKTCLSVSIVVLRGTQKTQNSKENIAPVLAYSIV